MTVSNNDPDLGISLFVHDMVILRYCAKSLDHCMGDYSNQSNRMNHSIRTQKHLLLSLRVKIQIEFHKNIPSKAASYFDNPNVLTTAISLTASFIFLTQVFS